MYDKALDAPRKGLRAFHAKNLATQNILVAAAGLGLGGVFLGCHDKPEREGPIREALGIPDEMGMASILCIGHPAEQKEPRTQYDPAQVHHDRW